MLSYLDAHTQPTDVDQAMLKASQRDFLLRVWSLPQTGLGEIEHSESSRKALDREATGKGDIDD